MCVCVYYRRFLEEINASDAWLFVQKSNIALTDPTIHGDGGTTPREGEELKMISSDTYYLSELGGSGGDDNDGNAPDTVIYGDNHVGQNGQSAHTSVENMDEDKVSVTCCGFQAFPFSSSSSSDSVLS